MTDACFAAIEALTGLSDQIVFGYPHSIRVSMLAAEAATAFGWSTERVDQLKLAGLLHDIGHLKSIVDRESLDRIDANSVASAHQSNAGAQESMTRKTPLLRSSRILRTYILRFDT